MQEPVNEVLVKNLIATQFPQWKDLPIQKIEPNGWDNRTFRLGEKLLVRMPSAAEYATQVEKEQRWLPILAPLLPLAIPQPIVIGKPNVEYPYHWSVYRWIDGYAVEGAYISDLNSMAKTLAQFLKALHSIDTTGGPIAGEHSFYRGGSLVHYDVQMQTALAAIKEKLDEATFWHDSDWAIEVWQTALKTSWKGKPVWVHGDISPRNLLAIKGILSAVIDFGQLAIGDPACDLSIAWTLFHGESREIFRTAFAFDDATWARARAWALWKACIMAAGIIPSNEVEASHCWPIIHAVLGDYRAERALYDCCPPEEDIPQ